MKKLMELKSILAVIITLVSSTIFAQEASAIIDRPMYEKLGMSPTALFVVMLIFTIILLIALVSVAGTTKNVLNIKRKKTGLLILLGLISQSVYGQEIASEPLINFTDDAFWAFIIFDVIIVMLILYLVGIMKGTLSQFAPAVAKSAKKSLFKSWNKKLTNAIEIEDEESILLDHDYDGIKELDNDLPPWWKYGFYITIVWAAAYFFYFQAFKIGPTQSEEYLTEIQEGEEKIAQYKADHPELINEDNVVLLEDAGALSNGKKLFGENCVACHAADGGGGIGPNLTDKYWIYDGDIKGVFHTITEGAQNGMKSWKDDFNPVEIQSISSYVLSLEKASAGKDPQGENVFE
jgi:cytochrome c oxidase cbb3-type subunit 3